MSEELDKRNLDELYKAFETADSVIMKKYLYNLDEMPIINVSEPIKELAIGNNVQMFKIQSIVYDKSENNIDKLTTVYNSLSSYKTASIVVMLDGNKEGVNIYLGSVCRKIDVKKGEKKYVCDGNLRGKQKETLKTAFLSNFTGSDVENINIEARDDDKHAKNNNPHILNEIFKGKNAVSAINVIPSIRNKNSDGNEKFIQGIEKFIDSMKGKKYSVIFLADILDTEKINFICAQYEDLYAQLYPFLNTVQTFNKSKQKGEVESLIQGITDTTNESTSNATSLGTTKGTFSSHSAGGSIGTSHELDLKLYKGTLSGSVDYHYTKGRSESETKTVTDTKTIGTAKSLTKQNSVSNSLTTGTGEAIQLSFMNRAVKTLLDRIDEHIKRLRSFEDVGVFDCGVYFLAENSSLSISAATKYMALMRGENSSVEGSAINTWENDNNKKIKDADYIFEYLKKLYHPLFRINDEKNNEIFVSPTTLMSGKELAIEFSLPKKSVVGLPVIECAEFGRDVVSYDRNYKGALELGKIYHMHHDEEGSLVKLDCNSLSSHVFITGSTGAGKSNTVFKILSEATKGQKVKYLVVEPAKGEYKDVLGGKVYGTNPKITELLKINPFSFPGDILVSEHIDRLVEIFNVCWPMYAAMPAILKDAVIRAYESCGWDMETSENSYNIFPAFSDVLREVRNVLDESEYSVDNKGDYTGALVARIKSLTNGINGQIFSGEEISGSDLFDENVIVDLSRVGSTETKSLIMGLLVMKLQEYRMSNGKPDNSDLKHITVLEEAHNLLKRTSIEQSSETSNLLGKSVELIANSIAELRSFGEGFIIADQSPGLLDMSVIRNTNTKIVHRLPDFSDRELVGKAASLNDEQIIELAKLPLGVAAVYQNDWINPVLCHVEEYTEKKAYTKPAGDQLRTSKNVVKSILDIIVKPNEYIKFDEDVIYKTSISGKTKFLLNKYLDTKTENTISDKAKLAYSVSVDLGYPSLHKSYDSIDEVNKIITPFVEQIVPDYSEHERENLVALIIKGEAERNVGMLNIYRLYIESIERGAK